MMILEEQDLIGMALYCWVVFVLWATRPSWKWYLGVVRGIAAAVIKGLPKRGYHVKREQERRLLRAYARWHLKRGEGDDTKAWERDRKLLGTHAHKTRPEAPPEQVRSSRHAHNTK